MTEYDGSHSVDPVDSDYLAIPASDSAARLGTGAASPPDAHTGRAAERRATYLATFGRPDHSPVLTPGIAATLRRHPRGVRAAAVGAMTSGFLLFVIASVATAAGADPGRVGAATAPTATTTWAVPPVDSLSTMPIGSATPSPRPHKPRPAPADPAAISSLAANGIPTVALNAYRVAAARLAYTDPSCGVDWALLAGIGREESDHGRFAGAVLHADGISTPRIIGIALNGHGTALIRDTDHGRLDGDTVYDHAVGPMQFIPSTWAIYGTDANGDGRADIFNINDAALTAARYLCAAGGNLRTHAGQVRAVLAYNESTQYLAQVLALANAYRTGISISGIPIGNVTGALPPLGSGAVPPANPGGPTANQPTKPKPKPSPKPTPSPTSSAKPTPSSSAPGSTPAPSGTPTSPAPSPSKTCVLWDLLNPGKCAVWSS